jgi:hypothetical protein
MTLSVQRPYLAGALVVSVLGILLLFKSPWATGASAQSAVQTSNVAVNCEPTQQALIRQTVVRGELQVNVLCSSAGIGAAPADYVVPGGASAGPYLTPAVYRTPSPVVARPAASRTTSSTQSRVERSGRSWQKTAMIIGGTTGAGAGLGGLIGGKKGALIGAAIGGGGATIYEARKRQ